MYKCETSDPQAKGYVPSWYIPLFLGRIFRPEKLLLRRNRVARTREHRSSILTMQDRQHVFSASKRCVSARVLDEQELAAAAAALNGRLRLIGFEEHGVLVAAVQILALIDAVRLGGAVFASLCSRPAKSLPPTLPKLYTGPLLSYNRRDTEIRSAPPAHAAAAPV